MKFMRVFPLIIGFLLEVASCPSVQADWSISETLNKASVSFPKNTFKTQLLELLNEMDGEALVRCWSIRLCKFTGEIETGVIDVLETFFRGSDQAAACDALIQIHWPEERLWPGSSGSFEMEDDHEAPNAIQPLAVLFNKLLELEDEHVVLPLIGIFNDNNCITKPHPSSECVCTLRALADLRRPSAREFLVKVLQRAKSSKLQIISLSTLSAMKVDGSLPLIMAALKSSKWRLRRQAVFSLRDIGFPEADRILTQIALHASRYYVRSAAAHSLPLLASRRELTEEAIPKILQLVEGKELAGPAITALGYLGDHRACQPLIQVVRNRQRFSIIRFKAAAMLDAVCRQDDLNNLEELVGREENPQILKALRHAIRKFGTPDEGATN